MDIKMPAPFSDLRRHDDLVIPTDDGDVRGIRYEPIETSDPLPVLLMYMPYRNEDYAYGRYDPFLRYLAGSKYEVVAADVVGTGASGGRKALPHVPREGTQAATLVEYLAEENWSNGRVGMFGFSYGGRTSLMAAAENPQPLEAIAPMHAPPITPHDRFGGTFGFYDRVKWGAMQQTILAVPPTVRDSDGRWATVWREHLAELKEGTPFLFQFLYPDTAPDGLSDVPATAIDIPTFAVSGWRDYFTPGTIEFIQDVSAPKRVVLGPWRHVFPHLGRQTAIDYRRQVVEWFDRFLKDEGNGIEDGPTIQYWTERDGGGRVDSGVWRGAASWPAANTDATLSFALTPTGLTETREYESGTLERKYESDHTVGVHSMGPRFLQCEPFDTSPDDARSVVFETDSLSDPVELTGSGEATLRITPTTRDPVIAVRVVDVNPRGQATLATHGLLSHGDTRSRHATDFSTSEELVPGAETTLCVPLGPKSHVFESGHQIRVAVSGSFFPLALPGREHGSFTLHSTPDSPSTVNLPGRRLHAPITFDDEVQMDEPDSRVPVVSEDVRYRRPGWEVSRDHLSGTASVTVSSGWDTELTNVDATLQYASELRANVAASDPSTAAIQCRNEVTVDYGTESVVVLGTARVTRHAGQATTRVTIDGETAFEETWTH